MNYHNIKLAIRSISKNKLYSILSILGFTIGFSIFLIIILFIYQEKTVDHSFANYQHIYRLIDDRNNSCKIDLDLSHQINTKIPEISYSAPVNYFPIKKIPIEVDGTRLSCNGLASTTNDFFNVFSVEIIKQLSSEPFSDKNSIILTESAANRIFSNQNPLGQNITFNDQILTVSSVVADLPSNASINPEVFINIKNEKFQFSHYNKTTLVNHFFLAKTIPDNKEFIDKLNLTLSSPTSKIKHLSIQPLGEIYFSNDKNIEGNHNKSGNKPLMHIYLAIAVLILILSTINYINFNVSLQFSQLKNTGIRRISGASNRNLSNYHFIKTGFNIAIALALSLGLALILIPVANQLLDTSLDKRILIKPLYLLLMSGVILAIILLNSITPIIIQSKLKTPQLISGNISQPGKQGIQKKLLTIFQFSVSIVLLITILMMSKQVAFVKNADVGFDTDHLVRIEFDRNFNQQAAFKEAVNQLAFVESSSWTSGAPGYTSYYMDDGDEFNVRYIMGDIDFLKTFKINVIEGRSFFESDANNGLLFNETAQKSDHWKTKSTAKFRGNDVIGTVTDFHSGSFHNSIEPTCIGLNSSLAGTTTLNIRLTSGNTSEQMNSLSEIWSKFNPHQPLEFEFYDSWFDSFYKKEERQIKTISLLGIISLIITCMGIFGQIHQESIRRTKEIGIRKVNGAKISELLTMLNKDFIKWVFIAFVIATPIAYYAMNKWLENFAYKTNLSWWIFALAGVLALGIALLTVSWQSWRAATRNPVEALRYE